MRQCATVTLSSGNPHRDYDRHQHALEEIFSTHFPNWQWTSAARVPHEGPPDRSPSVWSTNETFDCYLHWIRSLCGDTERIHLRPDAYSVHRSESSRALAEDLGIELHFIPRGWTDQLQPLDRYVFGALKAACRRLFHRHCQVHQDGKTGKADAIRLLIEAWESVAVGVFEKAWAIYKDVLGEAGDDSDDEWLPDE
jgi:hypothetical protein